MLSAAAERIRAKVLERFQPFVLLPHEQAMHFYNDGIELKASQLRDDLSESIDMAGTLAGQHGSWRMIQIMDIWQAAEIIGAASEIEPDSDYIDELLDLEEYVVVPPGTMPYRRAIKPQYVMILAKFGD